MSYAPRQEILERYAHLLVDFGLSRGTGLRPGETVRVTGYEETKPLFIEVCRAVWRSGGNVIPNYLSGEDERYGFEQSFYELASDDQLDFLTAKYFRGMFDEIDHVVWVDGSDCPRALKHVDPARLMRHRAARQPVADWQMEKDRAGAFSFTIGLYGTAAQAAEAGLSVEDYWHQIIKACFLDDPDPISRWRETLVAIHRHRDWLNTLPIEPLHIAAEDTDLWMMLGERRKWAGGSGRNIPSRLSWIDRFMADTLYDENMGGPFGNTHLALGLGLTLCYDGDPAAPTSEEWEQLGFNLQTAVHTDIVSTSDRTVTAYMRDGSQRVIYAGGKFQLD